MIGQANLHLIRFTVVLCEVLHHEYISKDPQWPPWLWDIQCHHPWGASLTLPMLVLHLKHEFILVQWILLEVLAAILVGGLQQQGETLDFIPVGTVVGNV